MAVTAKYTAPLQVVATPAMRDEIKAISDTEERSMAAVIRDLLEESLERRRGVGEL